MREKIGKDLIDVKKGSQSRIFFFSFVLKMKHFENDAKQVMHVQASIPGSSR